MSRLPSGKSGSYCFVRTLIILSVYSVFFFAIRVNAQTASQYTFSTATGASLTTMTGSTLIMGSNLDDSASTTINIGFSFTFAGTAYTQFSVNSNGLMRLGSTAVTNAWQNGITTGPFPALMPLWDDGHTGSNGGVRYLLTGTAPNRQLTVEWTIRSYSGETGNYTKTFQAWLFETSNVVQYVYGTGTAATSASIGIASSSTTYQSVSTSTNTASTTTPNNSVTTWAGSGRTYVFTPPVIQNCSGTPAAGTVSGTNVLCSGLTTILTASGATPTSFGGISYQWQESDDNGVGDPWASVVGGSGGTTLVYTTPALTTSRYYRLLVSCSFSGLSASTTEYLVTVNPRPTVTVSPTTSTLCAGNSVVLTASGADTYAWSPSTGLNATTGASVTATPTVSTTYTVTGTTTSSGCTATATSAINTTVGINASAGANPVNICPGGATTLNAVANTSTSGYTLASIPYQLYPTTGFTTITSWTGTADDGSAAVTLPFNWFFYGNSYTSAFIGTNGYLIFGTTSTAYQAVAIPATAAPNNYIALCWTDLNPGSGGTISYGTVGTAPNRVFVVDYSGVLFYNASGSIATGQICLFEDGHIEIHATTLDRGTSTAAAVMGIENSGGTAGTAVTGRNGGTWSVTAPEAWSFTPAYPAFTYSWSPATGLSNPNIANPGVTGVVTTSSYTVTVSGGGGCAATATATIITGQPFSVSAASSANNFCFGGTTNLTANATGGGVPYSYSWSTGGTTIGTTGALTVAPPAGTTTYTVSASDNCGNTSSATVSVTVIAPPNVGATASSSLVCGSGSVTLNATGANGYSWVPADELSVPFGATVTASPSVSTLYTVTGTDAAGCTATATVQLTVVPGVTLQATATPSNLCTGTSSQLNANATQEAPYSLAQVAYLPLSTAGFQTITSWTSAGTGNDDYFGPVALPFSFNFFGQNKSQLYIGSNGFITFGTPSTDPFSQLFPDPAHPNDVVALCWGDLDPGAGGTVKYGVVGTAPNRIFVVDLLSVPFFGIASGSNVTGQIHLYETSGRIELHLASVQHNGSGALNGMGIENASGTRAHYPLGRNGGLITWNVISPEAWRFDRLPFSLNYSWTPASGLNSSSIANPVAGPLAGSATYTVTATDNFGCTATASLSLSVGQPLNVQAGATATILCLGSNTTLQAIISGGGEPYGITWKQGVTTIGNTADLVVTPPLGTTIYTVSVSDACGGTGSSTVQVTVLNSPSVSVTSSGSLICGSGSVTMTASGATSYVWSPSIGLSATTGTTVIASPNGTTTYTVTGSISGCSATATRTITVAPAVQQLDLSADQISGCSPLTTSLHAQACFSALTNYKVDSSSADYAPTSSGFVTFNGRDDGSVVIALPFPFRFFGNTYSSAYISTNGYLGFGSSSSAYTTATMPASGVPNNFIALVWNDMIHSTVNSGVDTFTVGSPGARAFVVRFNAGAVSFFDGTTSYGSFGGKIILHESSNAIELRIDAMNMGALATRNKVLGIENSTGLLAFSVPGKNNTNWVQSTPITYSFTPSLQCSGTSAFMYAWSPSTGLNDPASANPVLTNLLSGTTYTVTATSSDGCSRTSTLSIQVYNNPPVPTVTTTGSTDLCWDGVNPLSSVLLTADTTGSGPGASFMWNDVYGTSSTSLNVTPDVVIPSPYGFQAIVTDFRGCSSTSTPVSVSTALYPTIASLNPSSGCPGDSIDVAGTNFSTVVSVDFFGVPAGFRIVNANLLRIEVPPGALSGSINLATSTGCSESSSMSFTVNTCGGSLLDMTLLIQGYYDGAGGMTGALYNSGISLDPTDCEFLHVCLMDAGTLTETDCFDEVLKTNGSLQISIPGGYVGSSFYLKITGRNILETWTTAPVQIVSPFTVLDLTTAANTVFGDNQVQVSTAPARWAIWSGDLNQDDLIEATDYSTMENDVQQFLFGYVPSDITGDGIVEASDYALVENNSLLFLFSITP